MTLTGEYSGNGSYFVLDSVGNTLYEEEVLFSLTKVFSHTLSQGTYYADIFGFISGSSGSGNGNLGISCCSGDEESNGLGASGDNSSNREIVVEVIVTSNDSCSITLIDEKDLPFEI